MMAELAPGWSFGGAIVGSALTMTMTVLLLI